MPRKNKDDYNQYMRDYRRDKTKQKKEQTMEEYKEDKEKSEMKSDGTAQEVLSEVGKELYKTARNVTKNPVTEEEDPLFKILDKVEKYSPIIMKLFSGFSDAAKSFQATMGQQRQPMQQQHMGVQAPEGWINSPPMERLKRKYDGTGWYEKGLAYEQAKNGVPMYSQPIQVTRRDQTKNDPLDAPAPQSMRELSKKYGESEWDSTDAATPALPERKPEEEKPITQKEQKELKEEMMTNDDKLREISKTLNEDAKRYIMMGIDYLKKLDMETFKSKVNELDKLFEKFAPLAQMLMPIHLKEAVRQTPSSDLLMIAKEQMPDKYKYLEDNNKLDNLTQMFEKFKGMI